MWLHVGVQKTGSTSLQRFLQLNAPDLAGELVIRTPDEGTAMRPLGRAAIALSLTSKGGDAPFVAAFHAVLDTLPAGAEPVVLSHENLAGAMPGNGGETRLYPALPRLAGLLARTAADRGFDARFVLYTRRMGGWKRSVWAQAIRTDGYSRDWSGFADETAGLPGWKDLIRRLEPVTGPDRLHRLRLEDEPDMQRPGSRMLRLIGLTQARIAALAPLEGRAMERLSDASTEFLRRVNMLAINPHARDRISELVSRSQTLFAADAPPKGTS